MEAKLVECALSGLFNYRCFTASIEVFQVRGCTMAVMCSLGGMNCCNSDGCNSATTPKTAFLTVITTAVVVIFKV